MGSGNPPKLELDLGSQEPLSATASASLSDRPPIPKIEVPPGSEDAIDPNSPPHDLPSEPSATSQASDRLREHKDNIPLEDMPPSSGTAVAGPGATTSSPDADTTPVVESADASQPYIGPAKTGSTDDGPPGPGAEPAVYTTLCVANTENRHRWKITKDYMQRRDVAVPASSSAPPPSTTTMPGDELLDVNISQLKRMLHADWRTDWEPRPAESSQIRLISMGEQLQDDKTLREHRFKIDGPPRPILLSVRRPEVEDPDAEADAPRKSHGGSVGPDGEPRSRMCCCSVM